MWLLLYFLYRSPSRRISLLSTLNNRRNISIVEDMTRMSLYLIVKIIHPESFSDKFYAIVNSTDVKQKPSGTYVSEYLKNYFEIIWLISNVMTKPAYLINNLPYSYCIHSTSYLITPKATAHFGPGTGTTWFATLNAMKKWNASDWSPFLLLTRLLTG
jgi:hypothetical protein